MKISLSFLGAGLVALFGVAGAICGGDLTVIANAPNPAGQSLLQKYFPGGGIAPGGLFLAALFPTLVMLFCFALPG